VQGTGAGSKRVERLKEIKEWVKERTKLASGPRGVTRSCAGVNKKEDGGGEVGEKKPEVRMNRKSAGNTPGRSSDPTLKGKGRPAEKGGIGARTGADTTGATTVTLS